jgi:hypothetical protein
MAYAHELHVVIYAQPKTTRVAPGHPKHENRDREVGRMWGKNNHLTLKEASIWVPLLDHVLAFPSNLCN